MDPRSIIVKPVVSEKSYAAYDRNVYTFVVVKSANKTQIKQAIESIFAVRVTNVNTINRRGKRKQNRGTGDWASARPPSVPTSPWPTATRSRSSGERVPDAGSQAQTHQSRSPLPDRRRLLGDHTRQAGEVAHAQEDQDRGRNTYGRKTSRHRGGGHKQRYRAVDFKREKDGMPAKVASVEYDPNRNARIALLHYRDGEKRYIIAPVDIKVGDMLPERPGCRDSPWQRCRGARSPWARRCTHWN